MSKSYYYTGTPAERSYTPSWCSEIRDRSGVVRVVESEPEDALCEAAEYLAERIGGTTSHVEIILAALDPSALPDLPTGDPDFEWVRLNNDVTVTLFWAAHWDGQELTWREITAERCWPLDPEAAGPVGN